ncbi:Predicted oxidoreductase [Actinopolymorpha cephalotaxi]|uniref:Predicted oxidoreductase n=1 Tax=Actinopolymorpha cephalotaxi TaxID=504797 RepID=A0A1I3BB78_9ACTN|nr:aldo/keto reductase [Actinopolymorpha cephalotaxi]NYH86783.1 aryl-alcohol dehydrogenase-like predicted oxidoreductase [Actinopolymorpha cephalotaxi]SFH59534.1 Predicted oxidoreductase [Actinopolymorpha cephalotaxi]
MEQRFLGRSGLRVSELCLGTMTFGNETDEKTAHRMLDTFAEAGGTFVDTANGYADGRSEEILGRWMARQSRDDLVIATKVYHRVGSGPNDRGGGRKHIIAAVEASLRRLRTDYIDLYQTHVLDENTPLEETLSTLDMLVRSGKVRFVGASSYPGWQLQKAIDLAGQRGWEAYVCLQPLYNLLDRDAEWELIPLCLSEGLGLIAWSPLRMGFLSGRYRRGMQAPPHATRIERLNDSGDPIWNHYGTEHTWRVLDVVEEIARETERSIAQVSLRWVSQRPGVTAPIVGARTLEQLEDNLAAAGWSLTDEQMGRLNAVSEHRLPHPYDVLAWARTRP